MSKSKEFISTSESDSDEEPRQKKKKVEKKEPKLERKEEKKSIKQAGGEQMFQIAAMRYVTVSEFRGKVMVSIREHYEKDGELRPGKKGISLNLDQWRMLKNQIDDIDEAIKDFN